jgi:hypothetical protein
MGINDFAFACSVDGSIVGYFTYHDDTMLIVQSEQEAKAGINNFSGLQNLLWSLSFLMNQFM